MINNFRNTAETKRRQLLKEAFDMWLVAGLALKKRRRILFHSEAIAEIERKQKEIAQLTEENDTWVVRSVNRGKKKMKKIMEKHFIWFFLKKRLDQWAGNIHQDKAIRARLDFICQVRYNRRWLRAGFERFRYVFQ